MNKTAAWEQELAGYDKNYPVYKCTWCGFQSTEKLSECPYCGSLMFIKDDTAKKEEA